MGFTLPLLCNIQNSLIELSFSLVYSYSICSVYSDLYAMLSLYLGLISCMIRGGKTFRLRHRFQYMYVCSSVMSIRLKGGGSAWGIRVSLISVDVVSGLISVAGCGSIPWLDEVGGRW